MNPIKVRPTKTNVLVAMEPLEHQSDGGIHLHHGAVSRPEWMTARVLRIGPGLIRDKGREYPPGFSDNRPNGYEMGDRVAVREWHGTIVGDLEQDVGPAKAGWQVRMMWHDQVLPALLPESNSMVIRDNESKGKTY